MDTNVATRTILYLSMIVLALACVYVVIAYNKSVYYPAPEKDITIPM
jgi:hypothetical protein